jgi:carboxylesterase type B
LSGTVLNEATPTIFEISPVPLPDAEYEAIMVYFVGLQRATTICAAPEFALNSSDPDTVRNTLSNVGTKFFFTCANQANALTYSNKANVYLYELTLGCTNPDNEDDPMCTSNGEVCHEDDLSLVFGTCPSPTSQQKAVSNEMIGRWTAFANNGNPNIPGKVQWNKVSSATRLNALRFSANSVINQTLYADLCGPIFGNTVEYNFQLY